MEHVQITKGENVTLRTRIIKLVCAMAWCIGAITGCVPAEQEEEIARMESQLRRGTLELAAGIPELVLGVVAIDNMLFKDTLLADGVETMILQRGQRDTILALAAIANSFAYSGPRLPDPDSASTAELALCAAALYFYAVQQDLLRDDYTDEWNIRVRERHDAAVCLLQIVGNAIIDVRNSIGFDGENPREQ